MYQSLKLLSDMAAIRLDEKPDRIDSVLHSSLIDKSGASTSSQLITREASVDTLASSTWEEVVYRDLWFLISSVNVIVKLLYLRIYIKCRFPQRMCLSLQCSARLCGDNSWEKLSTQLLKLFRLR